MPIYEYKCEKCGEITELLVGVVQEESNIECKNCGSKELVRIFSKSNVLTKGNLIGSQKGKTCCGREERCDKPPCSDGGTCRR